MLVFVQYSDGAAWEDRGRDVGRGKGMDWEWGKRRVGLKQKKAKRLRGLGSWLKGSAGTGVCLVPSSLAPSLSHSGLHSRLTNLWMVMKPESVGGKSLVYRA